MKNTLLGDTDSIRNGTERLRSRIFTYPTRVGPQNPENWSNVVRYTVQCLGSLQKIQKIRISDVKFPTFCFCIIGFPIS